MTASDGKPGAESSTAPLEDDVQDPGGDAEGLAGEASDQQSEPDDGSAGSSQDGPGLDERIGSLFDEDAGFTETTTLSESNPDEEPDTGQDDGQPEAGADDAQPEQDQPPEDGDAEDLAQLELTEEDRKTPPRTQKRIKTLLDRAKAAEAQATPYAEHIAFVREKTGMGDEDIVSSIYDIARIRSADPDMVPVLEGLVADIRRVRGLSAPEPAAAAPTLEPYTGDLPAGLKAAVDYGDLSEADARRYVAMEQAFGKLQQQAQAKPEPAPSQQTEARPEAQASQVQAVVREQVAAANSRIATYLQQQGVKDLGAYYRDLVPVILSEAGVAQVDDIPIHERFQVVKDAHRALQERRLREAQQRAQQRDTRQPVRQNGQGGVGARTSHKPKSVASFYDEDLDT